MARKQEELPGTRRDDEPKQKSIASLDTALEEWEKLKGKKTRVSQEAKAARDKAQEILKDKLGPGGFYLYEDLAGIERRFFLKESVGSAKEKREKRRPAGESDE